MEPPLNDPRSLNEGDYGTTPLSPEERNGLIPAHITLRRELNELEQRGVIEAEVWAFARRRPNILEEKFIQALHRRMFRAVWKWAGQYRTAPRNLGMNPWEIRPAMRTLLDDVRDWLANGSYPADEIAVRFHHRLVAIHPFPNGNGRLSRLMADLLVTLQGGERFTWGRADLLLPGDTRTRYIEALRAADSHDLGPLIVFARS